MNEVITGIPEVTTPVVAGAVVASVEGTTTVASSTDLVEMADHGVVIRTHEHPSNSGIVSFPAVKALPKTPPEGNPTVYVGINVHNH